MKKYLVIAVLSFILGCFASSPKVAMNIIKTADSIRSNVELELVKIEDEIKSISQSYKIEVSRETEIEAKENKDIQVMTAGFACTPKKPPEKPKEEAKPKVVVPEVVKPALKPVEIIPKVVKPRIISVKSEQSLVNGRMMFTKLNVKLNKEGLNKVKKGAKVRIFIDYCYYESGKIESDGTVGFDIGWHPPLTPVKGKVGVSLFMQTNIPEIGSGIQYTSIVINT